MSVVSYDEVISKLRANKVYPTIIPLDINNSGYFLTNNVSDTDVSLVINILNIIPESYWEVEIIRNSIVPGNVQIFVTGPSGKTVALTGIITVSMAPPNVFVTTITTTGSNNLIPVSPPSPLSGAHIDIMAVEPTLPGVDVELRIIIIAAI